MLFCSHFFWAMISASTSPPKLNNSLKGNKILVVVTGASRGIGRELALQLAEYFVAGNCTFLLLARDEEALEEVKAKVLKRSPSSRVELVIANLAQQHTAPFGIDTRVRTLEENSAFDLCLVFHNAGTVGQISKKSSELNDENQWYEYLQTNLVSTMVLNNAIYGALKKEKEHRLFIVNITSLLSVKAYPSFTQYSVGKAAREAYFRAFAAEHPQCRVLNYAPGPVDTDMHVEVREKSYDPGVREVFSKRRHENNLHRKLLTPAETVQMLIHVLEEAKFESGARVDYFDK